MEEEEERGGWLSWWNNAIFDFHTTRHLESPPSDAAEG